jgi:hypothetical protein
MPGLPLVAGVGGVDGAADEHFTALGLTGIYLGLDF